MCRGPIFIQKLFSFIERIKRHLIKSVSLHLVLVDWIHNVNRFDSISQVTISLSAMDYVNRIPRRCCVEIFKEILWVFWIFNYWALLALVYRYIERIKKIHMEMNINPCGGKKEIGDFRRISIRSAFYNSDDYIAHRSSVRISSPTWWLANIDFYWKKILLRCGS